MALSKDHEKSNLLASITPADDSDTETVSLIDSIGDIIESIPLSLIGSDQTPDAGIAVPRPDLGFNVVELPKKRRKETKVFRVEYRSINERLEDTITSVKKRNDQRLLAKMKVIRDAILKGSIEKAPLVTVEQIRSTNDATQKENDCVKGLGLRRIRHEVTLENTPEIRGMINKVPHLVKARYHMSTENINTEPSEKR